MKIDASDHKQRRQIECILLNGVEVPNVVEADDQQHYVVVLALDELERDGDGWNLGDRTEIPRQTLYGYVEIITRA